MLLAASAIVQVALQRLGLGACSEPPPATLPLLSLLPPFMQRHSAPLQTALRRGLPESDEDKGIDTVSASRLDHVRFSNWSNTFTCTPEAVFFPTSLGELRQILAFAERNAKPVKVFGGAHSPSDIACSSGLMVSMRRMSGLIELDASRATVTVQAGMLLSELNTLLAGHDLALRNLGAISDQTVAGAISTGTHGTGQHFGVLATSVLELELLIADGSLLRCSDTENPDVFSHALCGLGCLGVIVAAKIQCEAAFQLECIQTPMPLGQFLQNMDAYLDAAEHVKLLWFPHTENAVLVSSQRVYNVQNISSYSYFWDSLVGHHLLEVCYYLSTFATFLTPLINACFYRLLFAKPKRDVNTSYKVFNFDCLFQQHVTEWAIGRCHTAEAITRIKEFISQDRIKAHFPVEIRFVRRDDIALSPCFERDSVFIGIIMYRPFGRDVPIDAYWKGYEAIMHSLGGRPHWAKAHSLTGSELSGLYPQFREFASLRQKLDPNGRFLNDYLQRVFVE